MSNPIPSNVLFSTRYKYFLNYRRGSGTLSVPAALHSDATNVGSITIAVDSADNFSQIQVNFSTSPSDWYKFPLTDVTTDANFQIATVGSRSSGNITLTFYLVNISGVPAVNAPVTISANAYLFVTPS